MQNKGLIKFFAIIFTLVSVYQLSFTFVANGVAEDAKDDLTGNMPTEKLLSYFTSKKSETNCHAISFESAYNEALKIFNFYH